MPRTALRRLLPFLLVPALACAEPATQVYLDNGELNYVGQLDDQANARLFALYDGLQQKPTVLSIRSPGGPTGHGLALGRWVRAHKLDVKVFEYCLSSCANYVFPAGSRKVVSNFAVVGLHGGLSSTSFAFDADTQKMLDALTPAKRKEMIDHIYASFKDDANEEQAYFKELGVRADYVTLGQEERYLRRYADDPDTLGWTYSLAGFERLGVHDIAVINPPWRPGTAMKKAKFAVLDLDG